MIRQGEMKVGRAGKEQGRKEERRANGALLPLDPSPTFQSGSAFNETAAVNIYYKFVKWFVLLHLYGVATTREHDLMFTVNISKRACLLDG
jgi:hypothetical protein